MSGPTLQRAENGFWYIHYVEGRRSRRYSTREKEKAAAYLVFADWLKADKIAPDVESDFTVADLWDAYFDRHVAPGTASPATARYAWKNLATHFGALTPTEITEAVVDDYRRKRTKGVIGEPSVPSTQRRELLALIACLNWAAHRSRKLIPQDSIPHINLPNHGTPRDRWLRADEVKRLLDAARAIREQSRDARVPPDRLSRCERFLWLALETAARKEAIFDLTWDRVDMEMGVIHLDVPGRARTKKRRVSVPISSKLRPIVERAYAERTGPLVLDNKGEVWALIQEAARRAGLSSTQETLAERTIRRAARLKPKATGISPHVLRHTAATHMARRGIPLWKIAGVLGNSVKVVEQVYATHSPDGLIDAVNAISGG